MIRQSDQMARFTLQEDSFAGHAGRTPRHETDDVLRRNQEVFLVGHLHGAYRNVAWIFIRHDGVREQDEVSARPGQTFMGVPEEEYRDGNYTVCHYPYAYLYAELPYGFIILANKRFSVRGQIQGFTNPEDLSEPLTRWINLYPDRDLRSISLATMGDAGCTTSASEAARMSVLTRPHPATTINDDGVPMDNQRTETKDC
jgi:hypothetical protein